jgi:hypothetical protein
MNIIKHIQDSTKHEFAPEPYMNVTTIYYDFVLKKEIVEFKNRYVIPYNLNMITSYYDEIQKYQNIIRNDMEKYLLPNLNYSKHTQKNRKPNFYALFILLLIEDPNTFQSWEELSKISFSHNQLDDTFDSSYMTIHKERFNGNHRNDTTCACGQMNCSRNNVGIVSGHKCCFILGSVCIDKLGIEFTKHCEKTNRLHKNLSDEDWCAKKLLKEQNKLKKKEQMFKKEEQKRLKEQKRQEQLEEQKRFNEEERVKENERVKEKLLMELKREEELIKAKEEKEERYEKRLIQINMRNIDDYDKELQLENDLFVASKCQEDLSTIQSRDKWFSLNTPVKWGKYKGEKTIVEIAEFNKSYLFYLHYKCDFFDNEDFVSNQYISEFIDDLYFLN